ncbi:hypothetical protein DW352_00765 [Pseudolabrys taiwanensis]|uniref:Uncharacterized protein n=2 Tax=Pseudolabrys taiwanensis TaxID=331696 RepID=A0A345ZQH8_9HYPH|nr:hypothetical protein DW352_00765 [Pseudolabrys taiwanensis]
MLQNAGNGSVSSFLSATSAFANNMATITTSNVTNTSSFYAQLASQALQKRQDEQMQKMITELQRQQNTVKPKNVLDTYIYFDNGASLNTDTNVMTMSDGTQIDAITGVKVIDPSYMIQMPNGAYLDTKNNILTMPDGTEYDTVTGLKIKDLKALNNTPSSDSTSNDTTPTDGATSDPAPQDTTQDPTTTG